jgi:uncharacterized membrane protein YidH (DUF202 family)
MSEDGPWDPGLQPERTSIAWVRTAITYAVVALLTTRLMPGVAGLIVGLAGLVTSSMVMAAAGRRAARVDRAVTGGHLGPPVTLTLLATALVLLRDAAAVALVLSR